jgi:hypothetical protein
MGTGRMLGRPKTRRCGVGGMGLEEAELLSEGKADGVNEIASEFQAKNFTLKNFAAKPIPLLSADFPRQASQGESTEG